MRVFRSAYDAPHHEAPHRDNHDSRRLNPDGEMFDRDLGLMPPLTDDDGS